MSREYSISFLTQRDHGSTPLVLRAGTKHASFAAMSNSAATALNALQSMALHRGCSAPPSAKPPTASADLASERKRSRCRYWLPRLLATGRAARPR
jgi:hypothetical protein